MDHAYDYAPMIVRSLVPKGLAGVYLLGRAPSVGRFTPIYVGRSDTCLCTRLVRHELQAVATHFAFELVGNPIRAFTQECSLYHTHLDGGLRNIIHPDSPAGLGLACPFCSHLGGDLAQLK